MQDFCPAYAFIMMHFPPKKQFLALVDVGAEPPSRPLSLHLSLHSERPSLAQFGTDGWIQQMFHQCVRLCCLPVFAFLFLTFARFSCCRMDWGWRINEAICICPKLFVVDCFQGRTAANTNHLLLPETEKKLSELMWNHRRFQSFKTCCSMTRGAHVTHMTISVSQ